MRKLIATTIIISSSFLTLFSQSVGIAETEFIPDESAALEIQSTSKGLLIPRMTKSEREIISTPANGLLVYQTDGIFGFYYFESDNWYNLNDAYNDNDSDSTNEIQTLSLTEDMLYLSSGGSVKLPSSSETGDNQTLSLIGDSLFILNGNYVMLDPVKDNLGNHQASQNIETQGYYISSDGDNEGILVNSNGDVNIGNNFNVSGTVTTLNLNTTGLVNLGEDAIQTNEIEDESVTTAKIADSQITGEKIHPMGASTDQYLKYDGSDWVPSDMPGGLNYLGTWDADNNLPYITNTIGNNSDYYVVSNGGNQNLGSGIISFSTSDWVINNGTAWEKINNSSDVNSVFDRTGSIEAQFGDYTWDLIDKTDSDINDITNVNISSPTSGEILVSNGSEWVNTSISGDISINSSGNMQIIPGGVLYNDLIDASGGANSIIVWNGSSWGEADFNSLETDASASNEIQDLSISGDILSLSSDVSTVNLASYKDNTDDQTLSFSSPNLSISGGNSVDLSVLASSGTDEQNLTLTSNTLSIDNGNSVSLLPYLDNTDSQDLSISSNTLSLSNDATGVDLSGYLDNTDTQNLSFTSPNLSISGGNSVDLSVLAGSGTDEQNLTLATNTLSIDNGNSVSLLPYLDNTDSQDLSISSNTLSLSNDATGVDLSGYLDNTDAQNLSFTSPNLSISGGNSIDLSSLQDGVDDDDADSLNETITNAVLTGNLLEITEANNIWTVDLSTLAATSDLRLKENIIPTTYSIRDLLSINIMDYDFKNGASNQTGIIAQDLYEIFPSAVRVGGDDPNSDPWGIKYGMLTPLLTKSMQDMYGLLNDLENANKQLVEENKQIKEELNSIKSLEIRINELESKLGITLSTE